METEIFIEHKIEKIRKFYLKEEQLIYRNSGILPTK